MRASTDPAATGEQRLAVRRPGPRRRQLRRLPPHAAARAAGRRRPAVPAVLPGDVDHRQHPPRQAERAVRPVRGQGDRAVRDGARDGLQAEAQSVHQVVAAVRHVPRGQPADRRQAARAGRRRRADRGGAESGVQEVPPPRRAGDVPRVAQQRVRERDRRGESEGEDVPGLPHVARTTTTTSTALHLDSIETRIAAIQDNTYPEAENLAEHEELEVRPRTEGYARHNFRGLNVFLLEMFNQFDDVLGVRKFDFMTGSTDGHSARGRRLRAAGAQRGGDDRRRRPHGAATRAGRDGRRAEQGRATASPAASASAGRSSSCWWSRSRTSRATREERDRLGVGPHERAGRARRRRRRAAAVRVLRRRPDDGQAGVSAAPRSDHLAGAGADLRDAAVEREAPVHDQLRPRLRDGEGQSPAAARLEGGRARARRCNGEFLRATYPVPDDAARTRATPTAAGRTR